MRKYLVYCTVFAATSIIALAAFNWFADPFWIFGSPEIRRFNAAKPSVDSHQRIFKITNALRERPQVLITGTSREDSGIDPKHPAFTGRTVFNASTSAQPFVESKELLRALADEGSEPSLIVFGLLFENANVYGSPLPPDYSADNFSDHHFGLVFNLDTVEASIMTVVDNLVRNQKAFDERKDGFRTPNSWTDQLSIGQRRAFRNSERNYLLDYHFPQPACKNSLVSDRDGRDRIAPMEELREAIAIAYRFKTDMRLFIGPSHARQWETIGASGLWSQFEDWKRMLLQIVESEAEKAHASPFPVWDFSGYNTITVEEVPSVQDTNARMQYYYESSHYAPAAGDLVLDRIFNLPITGRAVPSDFGVRLTRQNIEAHLANIRVARERYRRMHPDDVAEIESMSREVAKQKHCPN